jgi:cell division protein FtsA
MIDVPVIGETEGDVVQQVPRSALMGIVRPRVEEIFELVKGRLEQAGMDKAAGRRVVITGGGSQLQGVRELAARLLDKQVRLGRPIRISGLAEAAGGPAFSTCAGLLRLAVKEPLAPIRDIELDTGSGRLGRIGRWLKANF